MTRTGTNPLDIQTAEGFTCYGRKPSEHVQRIELGPDDCSPLVFYFSADPYSLHFIMFQGSGRSQPGPTLRVNGETVLDGSPAGVLQYKTADDQWTEDPDQAQPMIVGRVKWDGCIDFHAAPGDDCGLHFCGRQDAAILGAAVDYVYELATHLPKWMD